MSLTANRGRRGGASVPGLLGETPAERAEIEERVRMARAEKELAALVEPRPLPLREYHDPIPRRDDDVFRLR